MGKPKVDVALTPTQNYVHMKIEGINSDVHEQNITYIEWETLSSSGNATMPIAINQFNNLAHGSGSNWHIDASIKVANACDTTYIYKTITPPADSCENYQIKKTGENTYSVMAPCLNNNRIGSKGIVHKNNNIEQGRV